MPICVCLPAPPHLTHQLHALKNIGFTLCIVSGKIYMKFSADCFLVRCSKCGIRAVPARPGTATTLRISTCQEQTEEKCACMMGEGFFHGLAPGSCMWASSGSARAFPRWRLFWFAFPPPLSVILCRRKGPQVRDKTKGNRTRKAQSKGGFGLGHPTQAKRGQTQNPQAGLKTEHRPKPRPSRAVQARAWGSSQRGASQRTRPTDTGTRCPGKGQR
jgi:hypothetical protein